jgi:single-stranded DNA-binding protein
LLNGNLRKGDLVMIEGRLENRSFEQDGVKRTVTEIVVREGRSDVTLMAKAPGQTTTAPASGAEAGSARPAGPACNSAARSAPGGW